MLSLCEWRRLDPQPRLINDPWTLSMNRRLSMETHRQTWLPSQCFVNDRSNKRLAISTNSEGFLCTKGVFLNLNSVLFENTHLHAFVVENRREEKKSKNCFVDYKWRLWSCFCFWIVWSFTDEFQDDDGWRRRKKHRFIQNPVVGRIFLNVSQRPG